MFGDKWTVDEAFKQHRYDVGQRQQTVSEVKNEDITEADHFLLNIIKKTEKMSDEVRLKHLHIAIGYVIPFLTEVPISSYDTPLDRLAGLSKKLKSAYKAYCEESCDKPTPRINKAIKTLSFNKLTPDDWHELRDCLWFYVPNEELDTDISLLRKIAQFFWDLDSCKFHVEKSLEQET